MREKIKDILITIGLGIVILTPAIALGYAMADNERFVKISIDDLHNDYINMEHVVGFDADETSLTIYTKSGDSYYWER